jgi:hypothetical protein
MSAKEHPSKRLKSESASSPAPITAPYVSNPPEVGAMWSVAFQNVAARVLKPLQKPSAMWRDLVEQVQEKSAFEKRLLPPPAVASTWTNYLKTDGTYRHADGTVAVLWLVDAVCAAHLSVRIKRACRLLMANRLFTQNLQVLHYVDAQGEEQLTPLWSGLLIPKLEAHLNSLAVDAANVNRAFLLADVLGPAAVTPCLTMHPNFTTRTHRKNIRQDLVMPEIAALFDWEGAWKDRPEIVYMHVLSLLAIAVDPMFFTAVSDITIEENKVVDGVGKEALLEKETEVDLFHAKVKSFGRMLGKLTAIDDHRLESKPRPGLNIDLVRLLVSVSCCTPFPTTLLTNNGVHTGRRVSPPPR